MIKSFFTRELPTIHNNFRNEDTNAHNEYRHGCDNSILN